LYLCAGSFARHRSTTGLSAESNGAGVSFSTACISAAVEPRVNGLRPVSNS
jgi:hypothetical protein